MSGSSSSESSVKTPTKNNIVGVTQQFLSSEVIKWSIDNFHQRMITKETIHSTLKRTDKLTWRFTLIPVLPGYPDYFGIEFEIRHCENKDIKLGMRWKMSSGNATSFDDWKSTLVESSYVYSHGRIREDILKELKTACDDTFHIEAKLEYSEENNYDFLRSSILSDYQRLYTCPDFRLVPYRHVPYSFFTISFFGS